MKQIKKALALLLGAVLLMGLLPAAALAAEDDPVIRVDFAVAIYNWKFSGRTSSDEMPFNDLDGLTDEEINALGVLKDEGYIGGPYGDPTGEVERIYAVMILWRLSGTPNAGESVTLPYKDIKEDSDNYPLVSACYAFGALTEEDMDEDGNFRPEDSLTWAEMNAWIDAFRKAGETKPVTRLEMAMAIYNRPKFGLSGKTSSDKAPFTDLDGLTDKEINALAVLKEAGLMSGNVDNTAAPRDPITRIEAVVLLWRAGGVESEGPVTPPYKDMPELPAFKEALCGLYTQGVLSDDDMDKSGNFRPYENLTWPEMNAWLTPFNGIAITPQALAEELYSLGLFYGVDNTGKNFDLDRAANRVEGLAMLIRLLGKEDEARTGSWSYSFQDVPKWADGYVGYAYENGLAAGVSSTKYDSDSDTTVYMYLTFVLRALGYSDTDGDFVWDDPYDLAAEAGILPSVVDREQFLRADLVLVSVAALGATLKDSDLTLADKLIEEGVFTRDQYNDAMLIHIAHNEWA